jgi:predicted transcriptional regulator
MIEELIQRISQGRSFTTHSLAQEFRVSNELMEAMLNDLVRAGHLKVLSHCEDKECKGCQMAASCKPQAKMWILVEK